MPVTVRYHSGAVQKIRTWRRTLPGSAADRDALLDHYIGIVCRVAMKQTKKKPPPWDFTLNLTGNVRIRVVVTKIKRNEYEVLIVDLL